MMHYSMGSGMMGGEHAWYGSHLADLAGYWLLCVLLDILEDA